MYLLAAVLRFGGGARLKFRFTVRCGEHTTTSSY